MQNRNNLKHEAINNSYLHIYSFGKVTVTVTKNGKLMKIWILHSVPATQLSISFNFFIKSNYKVITSSNETNCLKTRRIIRFVYVSNSWATAAIDRTTVTTILGGVQAARPKPIDKWDHPGMGDAEFFPLCIAAGCSPAENNTV